MVGIPPIDLQPEIAAHQEEVQFIEPVSEHLVFQIDQSMDGAHQVGPDPGADLLPGISGRSTEALDDAGDGGGERVLPGSGEGQGHSVDFADMGQRVDEGEEDVEPAGLAARLWSRMQKSSPEPAQRSNAEGFGVRNLENFQKDRLEGLFPGEKDTGVIFHPREPLLRPGCEEGLAGLRRPAVEKFKKGGFLGEMVARGLKGILQDALDFSLPPRHLHGSLKQGGVDGFLQAEKLVVSLRPEGVKGAGGGATVAGMAAFAAFRGGDYPAGRREIPIFRGLPHKT